MAEPNLNMTLDDIAGRTAHDVGSGPATDAYTANSDVGRAVDSGLRSFYFPGMLDGVPHHKWSFLRKTTTIVLWGSIEVDAGRTVSAVKDNGTSTVTADAGTPFIAEMVGSSIVITGVGTFSIASFTSTSEVVVTGDAGAASTSQWAIAKPATYPLPDDFGAIIGDLTSSGGTHRVPIVDETQLRAVDAQDSASAGAPKYAAIRVKAAPTTSVSERDELLPYPACDDDATYTFSYSYDVVPAKPATSATDYPYGGEAHIETILAACFAMAELQLKDTKAERWDRFIELLKGSIEYDKAVWLRTSSDIFPIGTASTTQDHFFADLIREIGGEMEFGLDPAGWTHAQAERIEVIKNRGMRNAYQPVPLPGKEFGHEWRFLKPQLSINLWASIAHDLDKSTTTVTTSGTTATASAAVFTSDMVGSYLCPHDSSTDVCSEITAYVSSTVVTLGDTLTLSAVTFTVSPYFVTNSDATLTAGNSETPFHSSMVGHTLNFYDKAGTAVTRTVIGYASTASITVDSALPVSPASTGGLGFTLTANGKYRLPADFIGLDGPLHHESSSGTSFWMVPKSSDKRFYQARAALSSFVGRPEFCAVDIVKSDSTVQYGSDAETSQAHDLLVFPPADNDYTLGGRYNMMPPRLGTAATYPVGGPAYHEMFMASCLAEAELAKTKQRGPLYGVYLERLAAAISHDQRAIEADTLGPMLDRSDGLHGNRLGRGLGRDAAIVRHRLNDSLVSYDG